MITEQGALCETLLGTLPRTLRCMPLLPTTSRSDSCCSAMSHSTSAGSPSRASLVTSRPRERAFSSTARRALSTSSVGLMDHWMSSGASFCSRRRRSSLTGRYELATTTFAPNFSATSSAKSTALLAVSEPSVPTVMVWIICSSLRLGAVKILCDLEGEEEYLRFPLWMQALLVGVLAVVLAIIVVQTANGWAGWVVFGGIVVAVI